MLGPVWQWKAARIQLRAVLPFILGIGLEADTVWLTSRGAEIETGGRNRAQRHNRPLTRYRRVPLSLHLNDLVLYTSFMPE
jgi:hypothetical protein